MAFQMQADQFILHAKHDQFVLTSEKRKGIFCPPPNSSTNDTRAFIMTLCIVRSWEKDPSSWFTCNETFEKMNVLR